MTEKNSLASKPYTYFAICFIISFGCFFAEHFFWFSDKIPNIIRDIALIFGPIYIIYFVIRFDSGLKKINENGEGAGKFVYLTIGGWFSAFLCIEAVKYYF